MSGIVELAALCVVIVVGVPLACGALQLALMLAYGVVMFIYQCAVAIFYAVTSPFWIARFVCQKGFRWYRGRKENK